MTQTVQRRTRRRHGRQIDEGLIAALVSGAPHERAAEMAGCSRATVTRRLNDPEFRLRLVEAKNDMFDRLLGVSLTAATASTAFLLQVMRDESQPIGHRIRAAIALKDVARLDAHVNERR